jgi:RNA polymerase sigma factor for flagellar operon FliA
LERKSSDSQLWDEYLASPTEHNKERIVKRYLPLVKYVVGRMIVSPPSGLDYEDLLSFGVFGLLDAVNRFDISKGFSFQTFAVPRIRGSILDELRKYDWISRTGREKLQKLNRAMDKVLQEKGSLHDKYLIEEMGVDEKSYRETLELASRTYFVSLDDMIIFEDGEVTLEEALPHDGESVQDFLESEDEIKRVTSSLQKLPEREMQVLSLYYYEGLTLKEIGNVLGVSESRVSQIHGKALASMRRMLH